MQKTEDLVRRGHIADPRVPGGVFDAVPEPGEDKHNNKYGIRRMECDDYVRNEMCARTDKSDAALSDFHVNEVVQESRSGVAD